MIQYILWTLAIFIAGFVLYVGLLIYGAFKFGSPYDEEQGKLLLTRILRNNHPQIEYEIFTNKCIKALDINKHGKNIKITINQKLSEEWKAEIKSLFVDLICEDDSYEMEPDQYEVFTTNLFRKFDSDDKYIRINYRYIQLPQT